MIRKLICLFFLLSVMPVSSFADGLSDVLSVCKIELKDGKTIEGIVWVAQGGYNRYYDTNGFYIRPNPKTEKVVLFNPDFYAIQPQNGIVELSPTQKTRWGFAAKKKDFFEKPQIYYLHDVTSTRYQAANAVSVTAAADTLDSLIVLKRDIIQHNVYELMDYIPVFPEVPREWYVGGDITVQPLRVYTIDVERLELVSEPSQKWLDQINSTVNEWTKKHQELENFEVPLPVWFHQVIQEKEKYKNLFKSWEL